MDFESLHHLLRDVEQKVDGLNRKLDIIIEKENRIMATLADVQAAVTAEDTVVDSAVALLQGLAAQVAALAPNQAAINALAADITAKTAGLSQAVVANTPAAP